MQTVLLRCQHCGKRSDLTLGSLDSSKLKAQGFVTRFCSECRYATPWQPVEESAPTTFRDVAPEESAARLLLIDDDEDILTVLSKAMESQGFEVESLSSARQALVRLARADFDLILSDIRMPGFDGKQLFEFLNQQLPDYLSRVIFLTGDTGSSETLAFLERTRAPYLTKPIALPQLLDLVRRTMAQEKQHLREQEEE